MKLAHWIFLLLFVAFVLSFLEVWDEPYYHKRKVDFWTWASHEAWELQHGEVE